MQEGMQGGKEGTSQGEGGREERLGEGRAGAGKIGEGREKERKGKRKKGKWTGKGRNESSKEGSVHQQTQILTQSLESII